MDISIIIPNYKSEHYLSRCIQSIQAHLLEASYEIIIINNDNSPITHILPTENIRVIENGINTGFAKACNRAASFAKGKIFFFLNPDTEIIAGNIADIMTALKNSATGIVSPQLILPSGERQPWSAGYEITLWDIISNNLGYAKSKRLWSQESTTNAAWVSGAALAITKSTFESLSGFDENFFMYFEDVDLCKRVREKNLSVLLLPTIKVLHLGGQSSSNLDQQKKHYYASQDYYFKKHLGSFYLFFLRLLRGPSLLLKKN